MQKSDFTNMRHRSVPCPSWAATCPAAGGRADGVPLPAFTACKLWALLTQEGARLLLRSSVWGRGGGGGEEALPAQSVEVDAVFTHQ